jgi:hypothetical protein
MSFGFIRLLSVTGVVVYVLSACGGDRPSAPGSALTTPPAISYSSPEATPSLTESPSESPSEIETESEEPSEEPEGDVSPSGSVVLGSSASGRALTLGDIFGATLEWEETRYDIADRKDVQGIGVTLSYCGETSGGELELRLARNFTRLTLNVGQANNSPSSDDVLVAEIVANGRQKDIRRIPFDRIHKFDVNVKDVNALKVRLWIEDGDNDCNDDVIGVVEKLTVFG